MNTASLLSLVEHQEWVDADASMDQVIRRFQQHEHHYMAVLENGRYLGVLSDAKLGTLLGSRYGFSLHIRQRARDQILPDALHAAPDWSLLSLLEIALERQGPSFYHDIPLVDAGGGFLGILGVQRLVREQARLMAGQMELVEQQRNDLEAANHQLSRSVEELRQSEGRYESLFHHSPLGVALLTPQGRVETCNPQCRRWFEVSQDDGEWDLAAGLSASELVPFQALVSPPPGSSRPAIVEREIAFRSGTRGPRLLRVHASWIEETEQICAVFEDITEQRTLERGMAMQEKAALLERLAGGIAHELNNKLSPVVGFADLLTLRLERLPDAHKALEHCRLIRVSAEEAVRMVRQLVQLGRPPQSEKITCDLNALVQEAWTLVGFRLRGLQVAGSLELAQERIPVHVDGSQLKQVIVNLVINAIDALEQASERRLRVETRIEGTSAFLAVSDTGHGIQQEDLQRIFDPFFSTKAPDRGTGLGLSVCLSILKQHGGEIQVASLPGAGTTFTITLPLDLDHAVQGVRGAQPHLPPRKPERNLRALVVDDELPLTELAREVLQGHCGWTVEAFNHMGLALDALDRRHFDLVLTDLRMPGLDGFALLSWMQVHRPTLLARTVVMTADSGNLDLETTWGVRLVRKPFSPQELVDACRACLPASGPVFVA